MVIIRLLKLGLKLMLAPFYSNSSGPRTGLSLQDEIALWANATFSLEDCGVAYGRSVVLKLFFPNGAFLGCVPCFSEVNLT